MDMMRQKWGDSDWPFRVTHASTGMVPHAKEGLRFRPRGSSAITWPGVRTRETYARASPTCSANT